MLKLFFRPLTYFVWAYLIVFLNRKLLKLVDIKFYLKEENEDKELIANDSRSMIALVRGKMFARRLVAGWVNKNIKMPDRKQL